MTTNQIELGTDFGYQPENYGFRQIGQIDWSDGRYQFDYTTVWKHTESGEFFMADDAGCSCPSPYEDVRSLSDLTPIPKMQTLVDHLSEREANSYDGARQGEVAALVQAYREAR